MRLVNLMELGDISVPLRKRPSALPEWTSSALVQPRRHWRLSDAHYMVTASSHIHYSEVLGARDKASLIKYTESWEHSALHPKLETAGSRQVTAAPLDVATSSRLFPSGWLPFCKLIYNRLSEQSSGAAPDQKVCCAQPGQAGPHPHDNAPSRCESALQRDCSRQAKASGKPDPLIEAFFRS